MLTPPFDVVLSSILFNLSSKHHSGLPSIKCSNTLNVYSKDFHFTSPIGCVMFFRRYQQDLKDKLKTGSEFTIKPKCYNNYECTWKYSILPTPIKNHRQSRASMQKRPTNNRPFDISV
jgi:hypothetical protein